MSWTFAVAGAVVAALLFAGCGDEEKPRETALSVAPQPATTAPAPTFTVAEPLDDAALARDGVLRVVRRPRKPVFEAIGLEVVGEFDPVAPGQISVAGNDARFWFVVNDIEGRCEGGVVERGAGRPYRPEGKECSARAAAPK